MNFLEETSIIDSQSQIEAIHRSQAVIEFNLEGIIESANDNFLQTIGYRLEEIKGQHHRMFLDPNYAQSTEYKLFWEELRSGEFKSGEFKRFDKEGNIIWIQASYNPIFNQEGEPIRVIKFASDITNEKRQASFYQSQLEAIDRSQAVIEFDLNGIIQRANQNFLHTTGYAMEEIEGKHHRMFVDTDYAQSNEYRLFWEELRSGEFKSGEFKRIDKLGNTIWIQASYNPILDQEGKPIRVIKFASDITNEKRQASFYQSQLEAIDRSKAVIEFDLNGIIEHANDNFLRVTGYSLEEIKGKHHHMFVESDYANSLEYAEFWQQLKQGQFKSGEFKRFGKYGNEIWIHATYNPIIDPVGNPMKVIKFASDITEQVLASNRLKESVDSMLEVVKAASEGNLTVPITIEGNDSIGMMAAGLKRFLENEKKNIQEIKFSATELARHATMLIDLSSSLSQKATRSTDEANTVSVSATEISQNIQTLAAGTEEMTASIHSVSTSAEEASKVASEAVTQAEKTNTIVQALGESSNEIGNVVKVITSIAQQTNLLALNATIEAARAGEKGKGFAVVASEVKELAKQTAQATKEISDTITAIQKNTGDAVSDITHIGQIIQQISDFQAIIATAVDEQSTTTTEMAKNVNDVAEGSAGIADSVESVAHSTKFTLDSSVEINELANELKDTAQQLNELVANYTI